MGCITFFLTYKMFLFKVISSNFRLYHPLAITEEQSTNGLLSASRDLHFNLVGVLAMSTNISPSAF